jgi:hypothetical protein
VRTEIGLADEIAEGRGPPETARAMNHFPHRPRLRAALPASKHLRGAHAPRVQ